MSRGDLWSRRKAAVLAEEQAAQQAIEAEAAEAELAELEQQDDAEILASLDLPDPDTLKLGDDVRGFMSRAVPDRLRRRALRSLWRLNPVLANIDGLVDYGEDFTDAACVIENMQTTYQVGKGMLAHVEEMERQAAEAAAQEAATQEEAAQEEAARAETNTPPGDAPQTADDMVAGSATESSPETASEPSPVVTLASTIPPGDDEPGLSTPAPRRMRFDFHG